MESHHISAQALTLATVEELLQSGASLMLSDDATQRITRCADYLKKRITQSEARIYGVNTGFGALCDTAIAKDDLSKLQENLVMSHACGTGEEIAPDILRLMLLLKIHALSLGHSGAQLGTVQRLLAFYNLDVLPVVYSQGSLGASGDLAPLAHLSLPLLGMGEVWFQGGRLSGELINQKMGWEAIKLEAKEGLALLNGTQFMSAHAVNSLIRAQKLMQWADFLAALSLDAYLGLATPFMQNPHKVRPHQGQQATAANVRAWLQGSELQQQPKEYVQDPYSFRCVPQVHGASKDALAYITQVVETEINSVTDNPLIFPEDDEILSAGNFHGQPLALVLDHLAVAMAEIGSISERRTYKLIGGKRELPAFLVANPGLDSGLMITQYTAASIVSQNKQLCTPASVDTIDSSNGQEDHVSMGANAATKALRVVQNVERVLAIELITASQALEFRRPAQSSPAIEQVVEDFRAVVPFIEHDRVLATDIEAAVQFIKTYQLPAVGA